MSEEVAENQTDLPEVRIEAEQIATTWFKKSDVIRKKHVQWLMKALEKDADLASIIAANRLNSVWIACGAEPYSEPRERNYKKTFNTLIERQAETARRNKGKPPKTFSYLLIWLAYYYPEIAINFLNRAIGKGKWSFGCLHETGEIGFFEHTWEKLEPRLLEQEDVSTSLYAFYSLTPERTSKRFADCEAISRMAKHVSGSGQDEDRISKVENFFESYPNPPGFFASFNMPEGEFAKIVWSATNTLKQAVADPKFLTSEMIDQLIQYLNDFMVDLPDSETVRFFNTLENIRTDLVPRGKQSDYNSFRFNRQRRNNTDIRRLRMIHKSLPPKSLLKSLKQLQSNHLNAMPMLEQTNGDYVGAEMRFNADLAMSLSSAIHALCIDPENRLGAEHPSIMRWREQLDDLCKSYPGAVVQSCLAELQIAALSNDPLYLPFVLDELMQRFETLKLTEIPMYTALKLGRLSLTPGFRTTPEARKFFGQSGEKQIEFFLRSNIGIIPTLRDRFLKEHIEAKSPYRKIIIARFSSVL